MLSDMGIVAPPADALNAAIYLHNKEYGKAALSAAAIVPFLGEIKKGWNYLKNAEEYVTLYRGIKGIDSVDELYDATGRKLVGNWGKKFERATELIDGRVVFDRLYNVTHRGKKLRGILNATFPKNLNWDDLVFTTSRFDKALDYAQGF